MGLHRNTRAGLLFVQRAFGKLAVVGHRPGVEQNLAARLIGVAAFDEPLDEVDHLGNIVGGARLHSRLKAAECGDVIMELVGGLFRHRMDGVVERQMRIVAQCPRVDLVVEVSDVAGIGYVVFAIDVA